jgi:hypothetical protein
MAILLKVGYKNIRIAAAQKQKHLKWVVIGEWFIGFYVIFAFIYTLKNTIPILSAAVSMFGL